MKMHYEVLATLILFENIKIEDLRKELMELGDCVEFSQNQKRLRVHLHGYSEKAVNKVREVLKKYGEIEIFEAEKEFYSENSSIGLIVDQTSDLPDEIRKKYKIENVIKYYVSFPEEEFEGKLLEGKNFYEKMRKAKEPPYTSFPPIKKFKQAYYKALNKFDYVIVILLSSALSGAYESAINAKSKIDKQLQDRIEIVDSKTASVAQGLLSLEAQNMIVSGAKTEKILERIEQLKKKIKVFGFIEDIKWAEYGGRVSHAMAKVITVLEGKGVRLALSVNKKGKVKMTKLRISARNRVDSILKKIEKDGKNKKLKVAIAHGGVEDQKNQLANKVKSLGHKVVFSSVLTPVIGAHAGPGTLIIAYF